MDYKNEERIFIVPFYEEGGFGSGGCKLSL
jgi:hypothetical protein